MLSQTVKIAIRTLSSNPLPVGHTGPQDTGILRSLLGPHRHQTLVTPAPNLHVKCPTFSAKPEKEADSHLLHISGWMNTKRIAEEGKCAGFCLALARDAPLWYDSIIPVATDWSKLQKFSGRQLSKLG